jgi:hypothetical protein
MFGVDSEGSTWALSWENTSTVGYNSRVTADTRTHLDRSALEAVAALVASCMNCGEEHQYRPVKTCLCGECSCQGRMTWAHPGDGHAYRTRFGTDVAQWIRDQGEVAR